MLKQGGKEVKEHNQFIEFQKFVACFEKNSPWISSDLINETLPCYSPDSATKKAEFRGRCPWKSLSPTKMGDHSPNSVRLSQ